MDATSCVIFPVDEHRGIVGTDGVATVHARMPTALQLFAEGGLSRVGGESVQVSIGGKELGPMVLTEVRCGGEFARYDVAVLVFRPANP